MARAGVGLNTGLFILQSFVLTSNFVYKTVSRKREIFWSAIVPTSLFLRTLNKPEKDIIGQIDLLANYCNVTWTHEAANLVCEEFWIWTEKIKNCVRARSFKILPFLFLWTIGQLSLSDQNWVKRSSGLKRGAKFLKQAKNRTKNSVAVASRLGSWFFYRQHNLVRVFSLPFSLSHPFSPFLTLSHPLSLFLDLSLTLSFLSHPFSPTLSLFLSLSLSLPPSFSVYPCLSLLSHPFSSSLFLSLFLLFLPPLSLNRHTLLTHLLMPSYLSTYIRGWWQSRPNNNHNDLLDFVLGHLFSNLFCHLSSNLFSNVLKGIFCTYCMILDLYLVLSRYS